MNQYKKNIGLGPHLRGDGRCERHFLMWAIFSLAAFAMTACGFHLRGTGKVEMPPALSVLQVRVEGNLLENNPLLVAVKSALHTQTDIQIQESGDAPRLVLYGERSDSRVLSVTSTGKVDEYLLKYEVSFHLLDVENKPLSESQTVKVQRDHQFDRLNVLAKEREEQELRSEMQRDAAQQILRRLSRITLIDSDANKR
jgi:LPS-assembly lipoprotein